MLSQQETIRYSRQIVLPQIGVEGQLKLKAARVLIIGAGGLGCPVLQYLAAAGVGTIGIVDYDQVEESNLQRQILYTSTDLGKFKAEVAKEKAISLNSFIHVDAYVIRVTKENILQLIESYDIIIDGTDNFSTRYLINDACVIMCKPLVFGSIFKFEGQVSVFNYNNGPTYRCIFPELPDADAAPNCATIGVLASLPGIVGTHQANEAIKIITGAGEVLSGRVLIIDALLMQMQSFFISAIEKNKTITHLGNYGYDCEPDVSSIQPAQLQELLQTEKVQLVDVREPEEHAAFNIGGINIPLIQLTTDDQLLTIHHNIILYCTSGLRSKKAAEILTNRGLKNVLSLQGGIMHLQTF